MIFHLCFFFRKHWKWWTTLKVFWNPKVIFVLHFKNVVLSNCPKVSSLQINNGFQTNRQEISEQRELCIFDWCYLCTGKTVIFQQKALDPDQINSALENYYQVSLCSLCFFSFHLFSSVSLSLFLSRCFCCSFHET